VTAPILPGAEPFSSVGGGEGALVLHGFTGNPHSVRGVAERLADAGLNVELPLLPGHGTAVEDLVDKRWEDWTAAAERSYLELAARCARVALVGLSMGGGLACWLAERHPEIAGMVLINPLVEPPADDFRSAVRQLHEDGTEIAPGIGSDIAKPGVTELSYPGTPLAAALSLFEGVEEVALDLGRIACPVLLFTARDDHVVPPSNGDLLEASLAGPLERVPLEKSFHVATLDFDRDEIEDRTVAFVTAVTGGNPP
jgi:carboxylesterase